MLFLRRAALCGSMEAELRRWYRDQVRLHNSTSLSCFPVDSSVLSVSVSIRSAHAFLACGVAHCKECTVCNHFPFLIATTASGHDTRLGMEFAFSNGARSLLYNICLPHSSPPASSGM